jgi:hypothetical protein
MPKKTAITYLAFLVSLLISAAIVVLVFTSTATPQGFQVLLLIAAILAHYLAMNISEFLDQVNPST